VPQARNQQRHLLGGLEVSDANRLKALEDENAKKKLLAEAMLDNAMLKDVASKNGDARRQARGCRSPSGRL
jgi:putative transposase